jgi:RNA polymerase sigma-70 factor (ECF subfamily)
MARLTVVDIAVPAGMDEALAAETTSFEQLVAAHEPRVRRLAHRLLGWHEGASDVDDVVQDVFLAALKNLSRFRGEASIATWLTRVTINRCRTHRRRQFLRLRWLRRQRSPADAPPADESDVAKETSSKVRLAVQQLSARDREVIVLFHLEELCASEIIALLGISRGAFDVRLHRARQRLKTKLADLMDD